MSDDAPDHSWLAPSSAESWSICHDYPHAIVGLPDKQSEPAAEGTMAHEISDLCLQQGFDAYDFIGKTFKVGRYGFEWTDEDADLLQPGIDWCRVQPGRFFGEHWVDLTPWYGLDPWGRRQGGTADRTIITSTQIIINDLKWGRGVPHSPVRHKQCMSYALGAWNDIARHVTDAKDFLIVIDQPRHGGGGGYWRTTLDELLEFGEWVKVQAAATRAPDRRRVASEKGCHFCRRRFFVDPKDRFGPSTGCGAFDTYNLEILGLLLEDFAANPESPPMLPGESRLTPEQIAYLVRHKKVITSWLEQLEENLLAAAQEGQETGSLKAVYGNKTPDTWLEKEAATKAVGAVLGDRSFTKKLITPKQASKLTTPEEFKKGVAPHVKWGAKKPILVPEDDAREPINVVTADEFDDLLD